MDDIYEVLIGAAPSNEASQKAVAKALRRRRNIGEIGVLSGDKALSGVGERMLRSAEEQAEMLQRTRQGDIDDAQTKSYQTGQLEHMGATLAETKRNNDMDYKVALMNAMAAMQKAEKAGSGKPPPRLRQGDITTLRENAGALSTVSEMLGYVTPKEEGGKGGKLGAVEVAGIPVPMLRQAMNAAARQGIGSESSKDTAMMWQNYQRFYELAERNNLFGATLTGNEQKAWKSANPSTAQTDDQIRAGLKIMAKVYQHEGTNFAAGLESEGYSPEAISRYGQQRGAAPQPAAPQGGPPVGLMTPEQKARLEQLRAKRAAQQ